MESSASIKSMYCTCSAPEPRQDHPSHPIICIRCNGYWDLEKGSNYPAGMPTLTARMKRKLRKQAQRKPRSSTPPVQATPQPQRNYPCPCGSGKKYKKCCLRAAPVDLRALTVADLNLPPAANYAKA